VHAQLPRCGHRPFLDWGKASYVVRSRSHVNTALSKKIGPLSAAGIMVNFLQEGRLMRGALHAQRILICKAFAEQVEQAHTLRLKLSKLRSS
jgi:hypothetical protein